MVFFSCDAGFNMEVDGTEIGTIEELKSWEDLAALGKVSISPIGYGEEPATSNTSERLTACTPEDVISRTHQINFTSKDTDADFAEVDFWNTVIINRKRYRFGWIGCDGNFYGNLTPQGKNSGGETIIPGGFKFSEVTIHREKDDNNDTVDRYVCQLSFKYPLIVKPVRIPGLLSAFDAIS